MSASRAEPSTAQLKFRSGTAADAAKIASMTARESMNPLGLKPERFVMAISEAASDDSDILGFGQLQPYGDERQPNFLELRTLIVDPAHRGKGLGTQLVKKLLEAAVGVDVYLTTLKSSIPFYSQHGFQNIPLQRAPKSLWFEIAAGTVVARIVAQQPLVVLKRSA